MRLFVRLANGLFAAVGVLVVAVIVAACLVDPNDYKDRVVQSVQDATGRTLTLGGDLTLTRSLWPTLRATDISLSNLPGGSRPQMVHVERMEAQLALPALLRRRVEITRLSLTGPNILFEQVDGKPNWVFTPAPDPAPAIPAPVDVAPDHPFSLRVAAAGVVNGMVTWRLPARTKVVGIRALRFTRTREGGPVTADATLVYGDNQPFQLDLRADPQGALLDPWRTHLHFAAFDTDATADGTMAVSGPFDLQLAATSSSLEKLNALLPEMDLPPVRGAVLAAHLTNGPRPGDLPTIGPATLRFDGADLRAIAAGLQLGATRVSLPSPGGAAAIDGVGSYAGVPWKLSGSVGVPVHPDGKARVPLSATLTAAAATGGLKGTVALDTLRFDGLDAAATLKAAALASLRPVLGAAVPALTNVDFAGRVKLPANANTVSLAGVSLSTAQGDLAGDGSFGLGAIPSLAGTWHSERLDLEALLDALGVGGGPAAPAGTSVIPATPLPWPALRGKAADLSLTADAVSFAGETWRDVRAAIHLADGALRAGPVSVAMPGSRMTASLAVDAAAAHDPVSFTLTAPALPLGLLSRLFGVAGNVAGTASVQVQLRGAGTTVRALAASLDGPFSLISAGGTFANQALLGVASAALDALGISVPAAGQSRLDCLGLAGSFAGGTATLRTIALQSTYLTAEGTGVVDLGRETVSLQLQPMAQVAGSPVSVPVLVQGPFRAVTGKLDAGGLQQLGFFLDGVFGGDRARVCQAAGIVR